MSIKLTHAALDVFKLGIATESTMIIRGVIDPSSIQEIRVDSYQREILSNAKIQALAKAIETSSVPDIELGMRGERTRNEKREADGEVYFLQDSTFVIDGLQRISAAKLLMQMKPGFLPRIGAVVHLNTSFDWERERFRILNQERSKLCVNVLLRNMAKDNEAIDMLHKLCMNDDSFVLHNRVSWQQNMLRTQIMSAFLLCKVAGMLHTRFGPGKSTNFDNLAGSINTTMEKVGRTTMRDNVKTFFELLDECYGVRRIVFTQGATYIRHGFLLAFTDVLARYSNFWRGNRLFVDRDLRAKIAKFPVNDPEVSRLATSSGKARDILYQLILDHINSGKRTRRLELSEGMAAQEQLGDDEEAATGAAAK